MHTPILTQLKLKRPNVSEVKFSKSDKKVLKIINQDYTRITTISIQSLAKHSQVSEPTINRLSKKLGCKGFPDFKRRLLQEMTQLNQIEQVNLSGEESSQQIRDRILEVVSQSIHSIKYSTAIEEIEKAVSLLSSAKRISFFGVGASGSVALDAQHKFLRFGIPSYYENDPINQQMFCSILTSDDVLFLISYTGKTKQTLEIAQIAKKNHIPCIGITRSNSNLAQLCDVVLNAETSLREKESDPMSSRIIHLVIIDILTVLLMKDRTVVSEKNIQAIQEKIKKNRL